MSDIYIPKIREVKLTNGKGTNICTTGGKDDPNPPCVTGAVDPNYCLTGTGEVNPNICIRGSGD